MTVTIKSQTRIKGNVRVNFPPTPSVYLDFTRGYANGLNPLPSTVTFTRADSAAVATQVGPNGLVRRAAHNLALHSGDLGNGVWLTYFASKGGSSSIVMPDGSTNGQILTINAGSGNAIYQQINVVAGVSYTWSIWLATSSGTQTVALAVNTFPGALFTSPNITVTTTPTRYSFTATSATTILGQVLITNGSGGSAATIVAWGAQLEQNLTPSYYVPTTAGAVYANTPRFDYDPVTLQPKGLLIEEPRSNIQPYSSDYTQSVWAKRNGTTINSTTLVITAPDGTNTAQKVIPLNSGSANGLASEDYLYLDGRTVSFYAKAGEITSLTMQDGTGTELTANLVTGVITGSAKYTGKSCVDVGNKWWRISYCYSDPTLGENFYVNGTSGANGTNGFYIWGVQNEAGTFPTSLIPTLASVPVSRALERAQLTGAALTVCQGSAVTLVSEAQQYSGAPTPRLISARKASGGNYTDYYTMSGLISTMRVGNSDQAVLTYSPAPTLTSICKTAFAFQANDFAAVANNGTVQTDGTGSIVSGIDEAYIGYYTDGVYMNGWMRVAYLYNVRLSNDQIKAMTVVSPPTLTVKGATTISGSTTVR